MNAVRNAGKKNNVMYVKYIFDKSFANAVQKLCGAR